MISNPINENFKKNNIAKIKNPKALTAAYYINLLPKKTETIDSLKKSSKQAYLDAGLLYKEKFLNNDLSIKRLSKLLELKPNENQEILALYNLYKIHQSNDSIYASKFKDKLINKYPNSVYTSNLNENQKLSNK